MLEAIISGSAANNHSERELWTRSGELQRTGRLEKLALSTSGAEALFIGTTAAGSAAPPKNQAFQPKAPPQPCATQNRVFQQPFNYKPDWGTGAAGFWAGGCRPSALKVSVLTSPSSPWDGSLLPLKEMSRAPILPALNTISFSASTAFSVGATIKSCMSGLPSASIESQESSRTLIRRTIRPEAAGLLAGAQLAAVSFVCSCAC